MRRLAYAFAVIVILMGAARFAWAGFNNTAFSKSADDYWARVTVTDDKFTITVGGKLIETFDDLLSFDEVWGVPIPGDPQNRTTFQYMCQLMSQTAPQMTQCMDASQEMGVKKILPWTAVASDPKLSHPWAKSACAAGYDAQSFQCRLPGDFDTKGKTADQIIDDAIAAMSSNPFFAGHRGFAFWAIDSTKALSVSPLLDMRTMLKNARLADEAAAKKAEEEAVTSAAAGGSESAGPEVINVRAYDEAGMCTMLPAAAPNPALLALLAAALAPLVLRRRR